MADTGEPWVTMTVLVSPGLRHANRLLMARPHLARMSLSLSGYVGVTASTHADVVRCVRSVICSCTAHPHARSVGGPNRVYQEKRGRRQWALRGGARGARAR